MIFFFAWQANILLESTDGGAVLPLACCVSAEVESSEDGEIRQEDNWTEQMILALNVYRSLYKLCSG